MAYESVSNRKYLHVLASVTFLTSMLTGIIGTCVSGLLFTLSLTTLSLGHCLALGFGLPVLTVVGTVVLCLSVKVIANQVSAVMQKCFRVKDHELSQTGLQIAVLPPVALKDSAPVAKVAEGASLGAGGESQEAGKHHAASGRIG